MPTLSIDKYIYIALVTLLIILSLWIASLRSDVAVLTANAETAKVKISEQQLQIDSFIGSVGRQNEAVEKLSLNIEKAVETFNNASPKIIERYSSAQVKDKTCEAELQAIKDLQKIFNGGAR